MRVFRELMAAFGLGTGAVSLARDVPRETLVAGLAWLPVVGGAIGASAAVATSIAAPLGPTVAALAGFVVLSGLDGRWRRGTVAVVAAAVSAAALVAMRPAGRPAALLVAPMLARWSVVVQCYGGAPVAAATGRSVLVGRARFREFAWASLTALGTALVLLDAVGLLVAVVTALVTLGVRVVAYRRSRGLDGGTLDATSALVETSALVMLASIGRVLGDALS
jgi:cobalamin synthase